MSSSLDKRDNTGPERGISKPEKDGNPQLDWKLNGEPAFPAIQVGSGAFQESLPGRQCWIDKSVLGNGQPIQLFLGEQRSGGGRAVDFFHTQMNAEAIGVKIQSHGPGNPIVNLNATATEAGMVPQQLKEFVLSQRIGEFDEALGKLLNKVETGCTLYLLFRRIESFGTEDWLSMFGNSLRSYFDQDISNAKKLRLVVTTSDIEFVTRSWMKSGLDTISDVYRLASLDWNDLHMLAQAKRRLGGRDLPGVHLDAEQAKTLIHLTGGQPLLVQRSLTWLALAGASGATKGGPDDLPESLLPAMRATAWVRPGDKLLERLHLELIKAPPREVAVWTEQLSRLLRQFPRLPRLLRPYIEGTTRLCNIEAEPLDGEERILFLSGWLGLNHLGRWAIRSPLHQEWAREVLNNLGRGR